MNDNGQIVGSYSDGFHSHGLIYANGSYITIDFSSAQNTLLEGINSSGQVVGSYYGPNPERGFIYDNGGYTVLIPSSNTYISSAVAINDAGEVVGVDSPSAALSGSHGYLYDNGIYTILAPSPSTEQWSNAVDINNAGQVLGEYQDGMGEHGFIYDNGNYTILDAPNANPAVGTTVFGFNDLGQVVGSGFTYSDGSYTALDSPQGTLGTSAMAINNSGQIVGSYSVVSQHGFVAIPS